MNLVIDIGNSFSKIAVYKGSELLKLEITEQLDKQFILDFLQQVEEKVRYVILTSVKKYSKELDDFFESCFRTYIKLNHEVPLPVQLNYETPHTLGTDRIAAIVGAWKHFPGVNLLVIDVGTCITYDFLNENLMYLGGGISPGIQMRFKALHTLTGQLPFITWETGQEVNLIGNSTENSILSGVVQGAKAEIKGIADEYGCNHDNLQLVLTGGDMETFDKVLKNRIFADPNLVLFGLNEILHYNIEN